MLQELYDKKFYFLTTCFIQHRCSSPPILSHSLSLPLFLSLWVTMQNSFLDEQLMQLATYTLLQFTCIYMIKKSPFLFIQRPSCPLPFSLYLSLSLSLSLFLSISFFSFRMLACSKNLDWEKKKTEQKDQTL